MATITLKGTPFSTIGDLPAKGEKAPDFLLTKIDLTDVTLKDFAGKKKILNIVPSLDTEVCAISTRRFEKEIATRSDLWILTISNDLPFAQKRFCSTEGITNVITLSQLRNRKFGRSYGVEITDGPLAGLLARAIVVIDEQDRVLHTELVSEIFNEPNYDEALKYV